MRGVFQCWVGGDVEVVTDSYNQVSSVYIRRLAIKSYGLQALRTCIVRRTGLEWE